MFTCDSCCEALTLALDSTSERGRNLTRRFPDPLWDSVQAEARAGADREPFLRPLIEQAVLQRDSIGDGLAMLLSQRLSDRTSSSSKLYDALRNVMTEDPTIAESARDDLSAIQACDPATTGLLHPFLNFKGFHALQAYRIAYSMWTDGRDGLAYHIQNRVSEVFGVDIHPAARIGSGVFIDHATGVVIGETAVIGDDVTILHGVTLGGTGKENGDRHPKVADHVLIGAGAQLFGNIRIGEGSRIGASSVVLKNVEPYSTVAGIPAQVVRRKQLATFPLLNAGHR